MEEDIVIKDETRKQIEMYVEKVLRKEGALKPNQAVVVAIFLVNESECDIRPEGLNPDDVLLERVLSRMPDKHQNRLRKVLMAREISLDTIRNWKMAPKLRNIGENGIVEFAKALVAENVCCGWTAPFLSNLKRKEEEAKRVVKKAKLSEQDWEKLKKVIVDKETMYTSYAIDILETLRLAGNEQVCASKIFKKSIHPSHWKSLVNIANQRWKDNNLTYRLQFRRLKDIVRQDNETEEETRERFDGTYQIADLRL